ncbi:MAG: cytochrome c, partial [Bacteroidia bacterium]|nr:cytochrome c [Bacteroidia bacterium]
TILLLSNRTDLLQKFSKMFKIPEMIISTLFLITGIYLATQLPFGSKYDYLFWIKLVMVFASIPIAIIGFKKSNKILAALSLLLITGSYGLAEVYGKKKAIIAVDANAAIANDGIALYEANCKLCHGADGKLAMAGAKDLSATTMDVAAIKEIILKGKSTMPPAPVNDEQAQMIADYVHSSLKGK